MLIFSKQNNNLATYINRVDGKTSILDANTCDRNGTYLVSPSTSNVPVVAYGVLVVEEVSEGMWVFQKFTSTSGEVFNRRRINDSGWTAWVAK